MLTRLAFFALRIALAWCVASLSSAHAASTISQFSSISVAATNFQSEAVVTNGLTLGGVRNTAWPAGGIANTIVKTGSSPTAGDVLTTADTSGTNGVWSSPIWTNSTGTASLASSLTNMAALKATLGPFNPNLDVDFYHGTILNGFIESHDGNFAGLYLIDSVTNLSGSSAGLEIDVNGDSSNSPNPAGIVVYMNASGNLGNLAGGFTGGYSYEAVVVGQSSGAGQAAGFQANALGDYFLQAGLSSHAFNSSSNNIGTYSIAEYPGVDDGHTHAAGVFINYPGSGQPLIENVAVLAESWGSGYPLFVGRTNNGTTTFSVQSSGLTKANAGFASAATDAAVAIATGGWTNSFGKNAVVRFDGTAITYTVYNNAGTSIYTNAVAVGHALEVLQPGAKLLITAGTGVSGVAAPF